MSFPKKQHIHHQAGMWERKSPLTWHRKLLPSCNTHTANTTLLSTHLPLCCVHCTTGAAKGVDSDPPGGKGKHCSPGSGMTRAPCMMGGPQSSGWRVERLSLSGEHQHSQKTQRGVCNRFPGTVSALRGPLRTIDVLRGASRCFHRTQCLAKYFENPL